MGNDIQGEQSSSIGAIKNKIVEKAKQLIGKALGRKVTHTQPTNPLVRSTLKINKTLQERQQERQIVARQHAKLAQATMNELNELLSTTSKNRTQRQAARRTRQKSDAIGMQSLLQLLNHNHQSRPVRDRSSSDSTI